MFCPKCGARNETTPRYCRQCGQQLATLQRALDGSLDEAITKFQQAGNSLSGGAVTFGIFLLIAAIVYQFGGTWAAVIDLIIGLLISAPMIVRGILALQKAEQQLNGGKGKKSLTDAQTDKELAAALTTASLEPSSYNEYSVTENTTLQLRETERENREVVN